MDNGIDLSVVSGSGVSLASIMPRAISSISEGFGMVSFLAIYVVSV
jgi:hypothetical protein